MAIDKDKLARLGLNGQLVYDETNIGANTHTRVGQALLDAHDCIEGNDTTNLEERIETLEQEVVTNVGIPSVSLDAINSVMVQENLNKSAGNIAYYAVYANAPEPNTAIACVGVLQVFITPNASSDPTTITIPYYTMVFTTNLILEDGAFDVKYFANDEVFIYTRSVNNNTSPATDTGWRLIASSGAEIADECDYLFGEKDGRMVRVKAQNVFVVKE